jgi:hypothetical protein
MSGPWECFHCGEILADRAAAAQHFGASEDQQPACQIKASDGGLLRALRDAEEALFSATCALHDESAEALKAWRAAGSRHHSALIAMEQAGYEHGLADRDYQLAILRRALAWHGDPGRMATTREEWQQEIDEAIRWVKDNPEEGRPSFPSWRESA